MSRSENSPRRGGYRITTGAPAGAKICTTMLTLLSALGLRHGEVRRLRIRHVDLARQTLLIDRSKF